MQPVSEPAEPFIVTHSDLSAFLRCRRSFAWSYVHDVKRPERPVGAAALGTRVHYGLEVFYTTGTDPVAAHDARAREDIAWLETHDAQTWEIDQLYTEMIIGRNCIISHQDWLAETGADAEFEVLDVEQKLEAPILGGRAILRGKVDLRFRSLNDGMIYTNDWKTSSAQGSVREGFERSYQSPIYVALTALQPGTETWEIGGSYYTVMRKTKNLARVTRPMVERFRVPATRRTAEAKLKQIEAIALEMMQLTAEVAAGDDSRAYPSPMDSCRWCSYKQPCELMDESPAAAEAYIDAAFQRGGKYERYEA